MTECDVTACNVPRLGNSTLCAAHFERASKLGSGEFTWDSLDFEGTELVRIWNIERILRKYVALGGKAEDISGNLVLILGAEALAMKLRMESIIKEAIKK